MGRIIPHYDLSPAEKTLLGDYRVAYLETDDISLRVMLVHGWSFRGMGSYKATSYRDAVTKLASVKMGGR